MKLYKRVSLLIIILLFIYYFCSFYTFGEIHFHSGEINNRFDYINFSDGKGKLILLWTPHWGENGLDGWGIRANSLDNCAVKCDFTSEKSLLEKSDVLMFSTNWDMYFTSPMPKIRRSDQQYVFYFHESPGYTYLPLKRWKDFFNLTMSYRRDSDIYNPYGKFCRLKNGETQEINTIQNFKKKKLVAWLVSSCSSLSEREGLVKKLQKYVNVDIYGDCGMACPIGNCMEYIGENYKFYLSFENSLCMDYITEKFYNPYFYGLVPITYNIGVEKIAPMNSYIDSRNFTSVKNLAEKLKFLDKNFEEYLKYFEWKKQFKVLNYFENEMCHLCEVVNKFDKNNQSMYKSYDIYDWWYGKNENPTCVDNPSYYIQFKGILDFLF